MSPRRRPRQGSERIERMTVSMSLKGSNIIVTGAAQGIGRAISTLVVELGGNVVAVDLNAEGLQSLTAEHPDRIITASGRGADPAFAESTGARGVEKWGANHGLVNNAGGENGRAQGGTPVTKAHRGGRRRVEKKKTQYIELLEKTKKKTTENKDT